MKRFFLQVPGFRNLLQEETGKSHKGLLLVLLLVVVVVGYVYYFTDLVRPGEEAGVQISHNSLVKKPLPPRPKIPAAVREEKPPTQPRRIAVGTPVRKTGAEQSAPVNSSMEKRTSSPQQTGTKQSAVGSESGKLSKRLPEKQARTEPSAPEKSPGKVESADEANKAAKKQGEATLEKLTAQKTAKPVKGTYTLQIGVYVTDKSLAAEKVKLKSAGLNPVITKGPKMTEPMNRLFIGEFGSYVEASIELQKLRKVTRDAFMLPEKDKFALYAGSYFVKERAEKERDRLSEAGLKPVIRKISAPVSTLRLTAGNFQTRESAEQEARRLKKLGVKASVTQSGV